MRPGILLGGLIVTAASCATIIHGKDQSVGINSVPTGATVLVDNTDVGVTPVVAHLTRKDNHVVSIKMAGFEPTQVAVTRQVSGWVAGNIIFGGLIGLAVDAMSGGMYRLTPEQVAANLNKSAASLEKVNGLIYVAVVLRPDPSWQRIGTMTELR